MSLRGRPGGSYVNFIQGSSQVETVRSTLAPLFSKDKLQYSHPRELVSFMDGGGPNAH